MVVNLEDTSVQYIKHTPYWNCATLVFGNRIKERSLSPTQNRVQARPAVGNLGHTTPRWMSTQSAANISTIEVKPRL
jgi:hypothetical protein